MKQKINVRLSFIAIIAIVFVTLGITLVHYNMFQNQVRNDLKVDAKLLMKTEIFQNAYASAGTNIESIDSSVLHRLGMEEVRITWIAGDGTVLFDNDSRIGSLSNHLDRPEIQEAIAKGEGECTRKSDTLHMNTYYYALLLQDGTILRVSTQARNISSVFLASLPVIAIIVFVILMICIIIGHLLTGKLLKPIEDMAEHLDDQDRMQIYKELQPFADKIRSQHEDILSAAKSRQDFTANISHELKTPITAISGYAELIENGLVEEESAAHIARQIRKNAQRLLSLITDIIQLSELDHREIARKFEQTDLCQIARECVEHMRPLAEQKNVSITFKGTAAGITADSELIREMIDNLIQNAIRYNKPNGSIMVNVTITNSHPIITVKDSGIGIPADQQERIFERFYRVDKSRSRETGGTGLGLAIVKHIADIHSAEIKLSSELGKGTEISIHF